MADSTLPFALVPDDDVPPTPDDAVSQAVAGALGGVQEVLDDDFRAPLGRSWALDPIHGGFLRRGGSEPVLVSGAGAVTSWCQMAIYSERFAHRVFSDRFGVEGFAAAIGRLPSQAVANALASSLERALLQHERIARVENIVTSWDPENGTIGFDRFSVVLDDESVLLFGDLRIQVV